MRERQFLDTLREILRVNAIEDNVPNIGAIAEQACPVQPFLADRRNIRGVFQRPYEIMEPLHFEDIANQVAAANADQRGNTQLARRVNGGKTRAASIKRLHEIIAALL